LQIAAIVEETLSAGTGSADEVADVLNADRRARATAASMIEARSGR
jgi:hypothetical protein